MADVTSSVVSCMTGGWCLFAVGRPVGPSTGGDGTSTQPYVAMNGVNGIQSDKDSYETIQSPTDHYVYKGGVLATLCVCSVIHAPRFLFFFLYPSSLFSHSSTVFLILPSMCHFGFLSKN